MMSTCPPRGLKSNVYPAGGVGVIVGVSVGLGVGLSVGVAVKEGVGDGEGEPGVLI